MAESSNQIQIYVGAILVAGVGLVVAFALRPPPLPVPVPIAVASATPAPVSAPMHEMDHASSKTSTAASPAAAGDKDDSPAWETTIDHILRSNVSDGQMAQMLINVLPTLPEDGQVEAANHITNLIPDSDYGSVKPLMLNAELPQSVLSVFFTDLMNRDDPTKLNTFLDIAQESNNPFQEEAVNDLQIYVGDDFGTDWGKWRSAVAEYLKTANQQ